MVKIIRCTTQSDYSHAKQIMDDYIAWLDMDLSFQHIDDELADFSAMYGPPDGCFLIAWVEGCLAGGVGLRKYESVICEMKRLFIYEMFREKGVGRILCTALIDEARHLGYERMRLDTLGYMKIARKLYRSLGLCEIDAYRFNPDPTTKFMELKL